MQEPLFSVITTGRGEQDIQKLQETFHNWEVAKEIFQSTIRKDEAIEFLIADAGENAEFPELDSSTIVDSGEYEKGKRELFECQVIRYPWWDTPSIGRNLGFKRARGRLIVFQDLDSLFSTGTELDYRYIRPDMDEYDNYFTVMYKAFKRKRIVAAAPSLRPRDSLKIGRRFGMMGLNLLTRYSMKIPTIRIQGIPVVGPSVPGCSITLLYDVAAQMAALNKTGPCDPELGMAEDHMLSRLLGTYGKLSYEKKAGVFTRTSSRVSSGFDILKSLGYAIKGAPYFALPGIFKYRKHTLSI
jgi:hypothetical protein